jgi:hypothetical protein
MGKRSVGLYCEEGVWGLLSCGLVGAVNLLGLVERCWVSRLEKESCWMFGWLVSCRGAESGLWS